MARTVIIGAGLTGLSAAYHLEKKQLNKSESWISSMLAGLTMLFKYPYVMGIFGMSFFFELINQALKVEGLIFGKSQAATLSAFTSFLLVQALLVHIIGFFVVVFGTKAEMDGPFEILPVVVPSRRSHLHGQVYGLSE